MSNSLLRNYQVQWRENRLEYIKIYTVKELKAYWGQMQEPVTVIHYNRLQAGVVGEDAEGGIWSEV